MTEYIIRSVVWCILIGDTLRAGAVLALRSMPSELSKSALRGELMPSGPGRSSSYTSVKSRDRLPKEMSQTLLVTLAWPIHFSNPERAATCQETFGYSNAMILSRSIQSISLFLIHTTEL